MAQYPTCWLLGSYALPEQSVSFNGNAESVSAATLYLYDANDALSLLAQVKAAMTAAGIAGAAVSLTGNRRVKISAFGLFTITWTSTLLRDLLGFTADMPLGTNHIAPNVSRLLWSPAKTESPMLTRLGVRGHKESITVHNVSSYSGRVESVTHGTREYQRYRWSNVDITRMELATGDTGGTYSAWFDAVAVPGSRWKLYSPITENSASTSAVTPLSGGLGPYVVSSKGKGPAWKFDRSRGLEFMDRACDVDLECHVVPEVQS